MHEWWNCFGECEILNLDSCQVLEASPALAAQDYAKMIHREQAPDASELTIRVRVTGPDLDYDPVFEVTTVQAIISRSCKEIDKPESFD